MSMAKHIVFRFNSTFRQQQSTAVNPTFLQMAKYIIKRTTLSCHSYKILCSLTEIFITFYYKKTTVSDKIIKWIDKEMMSLIKNSWIFFGTYSKHILSLWRIYSKKKTMQDPLLGIIIIFAKKINNISRLYYIYFFKVYFCIFVKFVLYLTNRSCSPKNV